MDCIRIKEEEKNKGNSVETIHEIQTQTYRNTYNLYGRVSTGLEIFSCVILSHKQSNLDFTWCTQITRTNTINWLFSFSTMNICTFSPFESIECNFLFCKIQTIVFSRLMLLLYVSNIELLRLTSTRSTVDCQLE